MINLCNVEVISMASKNVKNNTRFKCVLKASTLDDSESFDAEIICGGMPAEPIIASKWLNDHVIIKYPSIRNKLFELVTTAHTLQRTLGWENCNKEQKELLFDFEKYEISDDKKSVYCHSFMDILLALLKKYGLIDFKIAELATVTDRVEKCYLVTYNA